jgi:two-component system chemotaxis response regulator CheY
MIIIDEMAEVELAANLNRLRADPGAMRCIYFDLMGVPRLEGLKEIVITALEKNIASYDTQVFFCDDGDIIILASILRSNDYRELAADIAEHSGEPSITKHISLLEVSMHLAKILKTVESKVNIRKKAEELLHIKREQLALERKRNAILNGVVLQAHEEIQNRRDTRSEPALMIIEDDAFSRRLVENVLQKKYSLTGLGEATHAIETYARIAPNLLFLDINLPDVTGHELLEKILQIDPEAYVVMLSGNADKENITHAMSKGAKGFIAKPFTKEKLFQYIENCPSITL